MIIARLIPRATLEAEQEHYVRRLQASVPKPNVINIDAMLEFGQPRMFVWSGRSYRAPPLSFPLGFRCLVTAHALKDLAEAGQHVESALHTARRLLVQVAFPVSGIRRIGWKSRSFPDATPLEIEQLLWYMIHVPDARPVRLATERVTVDWLDQLAEFVEAKPSWVGADGFPLSWAHYIVGMRQMSRAAARNDLRRMWSFAAAQSDKKGRKEYEADWKAAAGW